VLLSGKGCLVSNSSIISKKRATPNAAKLKNRDGMTGIAGDLEINS
jgi:hypothetical protein